MKNRIITISREFGSGGRTIGKRTAEAPGIPCYDRELIQKLAAKSGFSEVYIEDTGESAPGGFLASAFSHRYGEPNNADYLWKVQYQVITELAEQGPCVIVGRCADYVLRNQEGVLNLFIHAPLDERIFRAKEEYKVEAPDIRAYVLKQDKNRAAFYEHFSDRVWGKAENFHLSINSTIGLDTTKLTAATTPKITAKRHRHRARPASLRLLIGGFTIFSLMNFLSLGESAMGNSFN